MGLAIKISQIYQKKVKSLKSRTWQITLSFQDPFLAKIILIKYKLIKIKLQFLNFLVKVRWLYLKWPTNSMKLIFNGLEGNNKIEEISFLQSKLKNKQDNRKLVLWNSRRYGFRSKSRNTNRRC